MPIDYEWHPEEKILRTRLRGAVTDQELRQHAQRIADDDRITAPLRELVDLRDGDATNVTANGLRSVLIVDSTRPGKYEGQRMAIYAPTDVLYGMARMFEKLLDLSDVPGSVRVFKDLKEAEKWLKNEGEDG